MKLHPTPAARAFRAKARACACGAADAGASRDVLAGPGPASAGPGDRARTLHRAGWGPPAGPAARGGSGRGAMRCFTRLDAAGTIV